MSFSSPLQEYVDNVLYITSSHTHVALYTLAFITKLFFGTVDLPQNNKTIFFTWSNFLSFLMVTRAKQHLRWTMSDSLRNCNLFVLESMHVRT